MILRIDCDACGGSCDGSCDSGAGTWPERQEAEAREITVSDLRNERDGERE